jgi:hypothetical protein
LKALDERHAPHQLTVDFEAPAGTEYSIPVRLNHPGVRATGGQLEGNTLQLRIPPGEGYQRASVTFTW